MVAGGTIGAVALSVVFVPHEGLIVGERLALALVVVVSAAARLWGVRVGALAAVCASGALVFAELAFSGAPSAADEVDLFVDLGIFLGVALIQGIQTGELRDRERTLLQQEHETALLVRLSAQLVPDSPPARLLDGLGGELNELLGASQVTVFIAGEHGELGLLRPEAVRDLDGDPQMLEIAHWVFSNSTAIGPLGSALSIDNPNGRPRIVSHSVISTGSNRDDIYVPMISMSAHEGVLRVVPLAPSRTVDSHELATIEFVAGLLATFRERQRLRDQVAQTETLKEADLVKSAIVSSVSHELKTPLAAATATVTSLLDSGGLSDGTASSIRVDLEAVVQDLHLLREHIDRLLEFSRLESLQWKPALEWNDIADLCVTVRAALPEDARGRTALLLGPDLPLLRFDFVQMSRAIHHLVENALAYSGPNGHVVLGAENSSNGVRIWVEDDGPGIPSDEVEGIFDKFRRGRIGDLQPGGTGLGLTIVRDIVTIHAGRVWVEDADPRGARFVIELPSDQSEGAKA